MDFRHIIYAHIYKIVELTENRINIKYQNIPMTLYNEEKLYRMRSIDPLQTFFTWIMGLIILFPIFLLLSYFQKAEVMLISLIYVGLSIIASLIVTYYYNSPEMSYDSFLEKYHNIIPEHKSFKDWFLKRTQELVGFEELYEEFRLYFFDISTTAISMEINEIDIMLGKLVAYQNMVTDSDTSDQLNLLCNLLLPFASDGFRGVEIHEINRLSNDFSLTKSRFQREINEIKQILTDARNRKLVEIKN